MTSFYQKTRIRFSKKKKQEFDMVQILN